MARRKTPWAMAAAEIRKELKKHGIKARVTSDSGSMTSSVDVRLENALPATVRMVEDFADKYAAGDFDGMTDMYNYRPGRKEASAKFIFVTNNWDDEWKEAAWKWLLANLGDMEGAPEDYREAGSFHNGYEWGDAMIWKCLGTDDRYNVGAEFWKAHKPRVRAAA